LVQIVAAVNDVGVHVGGGAGGVLRSAGFNASGNVALMTAQLCGFDFCGGFAILCARNETLP
jgi:hypothetical protein